MYDLYCRSELISLQKPLFFCFRPFLICFHLRQQKKLWDTHRKYWEDPFPGCRSGFEDWTASERPPDYDQSRSPRSDFASITKKAFWHRHQMVSFFAFTKKWIMGFWICFWNDFMQTVKTFNWSFCKRIYSRNTVPGDFLTNLTCKTIAWLCHNVPPLQSHYKVAGRLTPSRLREKAWWTIPSCAKLEKQLLHVAAIPISSELQIKIWRLFWWREIRENMSQMAVILRPKPFAEAVLPSLPRHISKSEAQEVGKGDAFPGW